MMKICDEYGFADDESFREFVWETLISPEIDYFKDMFSKDELKLYKPEFYKYTKTEICDLIENAPVKQKILEILNNQNKTNPKKSKKNFDSSSMSSPKKQKVDQESQSLLLKQIFNSPFIDDDEVDDSELKKKKRSSSSKRNINTTQNVSVKKTIKNTNVPNIEPKKEPKKDSMPKKDSEIKKEPKKDSKQELISNQKVKCLNIGSFKWNQNSCYMDSLYFSLLLCNQPWAYKHLLSKQLTFTSSKNFNNELFQTSFTNFRNLLNDEQYGSKINSIIDEIREDLEDSEINFWKLQKSFSDVRTIFNQDKKYFKKSGLLQTWLDAIFDSFPANTVCIAKNKEEDLEIRENIQQKLIALYNSVVYDPSRTKHDVISSCDDIRFSFKSCVTSEAQKEANKWWTNQMQDPMDLLDYLFKIFQVSNQFKVINSIYGLLEGGEWVKTSEVTQDFPFYLLIQENLSNNIKISKILSGIETISNLQYGDSYQYKSRKQIEKIEVTGDLFIMNYRRIYLTVESVNKLDSSTQKILDLINQSKGISLDEISEKMELTSSQVKKSIDQLMKYNAIRNGNDKSKFILTEEEYQLDDDDDSFSTILTIIESLPNKHSGFTVQNVLHNMKKTKIKKDEIEGILKDLKKLDVLHYAIQKDIFYPLKQNVTSENVVQMLKETAIIPDDYIYNVKKEKLFLTACILYKGAHYTTVFRCKNRWFLYNDADPQNYELIGNNLEQALTWRNGALAKETVVWFYGTKWL